MMSKRFVSLSMLLTAAAFAATFAAGCSSSGGSKGTPTPQPSIGLFAGNVTATYNTTTALTMGNNAVDYFNDSAAGCGVQLTQTVTGCIMIVETYSTAGQAIAVPPGGFTDTYYLLETAEGAWMNGTVPFTLDSNGAAAAISEVIVNLVFDSAGNVVKQGGKPVFQDAFYTTTGSFTLSNVPTNGPDLDGSHFTFHTSGSSWLNVNTNGTSTMSNVTGDVADGVLDSACFTTGC